MASHQHQICHFRFNVTMINDHCSLIWALRSNVSTSQTHEHFISRLHIGYESILHFLLVGVSFLVRWLALTCTKHFGWVSSFLFGFGVQTDEEDAKLIYGLTLPFLLICLSTFIIPYVSCPLTPYNVATSQH
jgi:hypothetical protein